MHQQLKPLNVQQPLTPDELRKLIVVRRPTFAQVGCLLCLGDKEVRIVESYHNGEQLMLCKPCLEVLPHRNISNAV